MNRPIEFMKSTQLLGVHISNDITNKNITSSVPKYYARVNSVLYDFRNVPCHVKAKVIIHLLFRSIWIAIMELWQY